jgi:hypothetical protein
VIHGGAAARILANSLARREIFHGAAKDLHALTRLTPQPDISGAPRSDLILRGRRRMMAAPNGHD